MLLTFSPALKLTKIENPVQNYYPSGVWIFLFSNFYYENFILVVASHGHFWYLGSENGLGFTAWTGPKNVKGLEVLHELSK